MLNKFQAESLPKLVGPEFAELLPRFVSGMANRMLVSAYKYGPWNLEASKKRDMMETIKVRLARYMETHNTEFLMDVANFCVMEATFPSFPDAHFRSTDADESPGIVNSDGVREHRGENA